MVRLKGKMGVRSWCKASPVSRLWWRKNMNIFEEGVYCCWQEGGKMSDTLGNTTNTLIFQHGSR